jgi:phage head maturation protease
MGGSGPATDSSPWDANAAMSACDSAACYNAICAGRKSGPAEERGSHALPHHKRPGGPANAAGVRAARSRFEQTEGLTNREAARRHVFESHKLPSDVEAEGGSWITFDDPQAQAMFKVDPERRTITGLLVPWDRVARAGFARWRFARGSLRWTDESRVKLNKNHERDQAIAVAVRLQDVAAGLTGTFKVARGEEGDRALSLAEDQVLDGFSIEVDFDEDSGDGWSPDPQDKSIRLVQQARLAGAALTAFPAFDDARVDRVAAARREGEKMEKEETLEAAKPEEQFEQAMGALADKITESHTRLTESLTQSVGESISAGVKVALEEMTAPGQDGPKPVRAARYAVSREEPVYRFDGSGPHSLVKDAWYAATAHEEEAVERLRKYRRQTEEIAQLATQVLKFAPQSTATAAEIIPPGYRPDLYVAELQRNRPLVSLASRGSIANATPFTVPVFTSSTTATADHVEGTNPADGSLDLGTKTVTPVAVSGRLVLTREIVDSSNPAIDQIALATMRESYARQTEAKLYTLLNGADGAGGTITAGFVPSGAQASTTAGGTDNQTLAKHIRDRLAAYPFSRFASPSGAAMGSAATARLATAVDTTQRPLFPSIGAQNASGLGNAVQQGWFVDGLPFIPAWAMTGVAAGDSQIFLINNSDLWVWESPLLTFRFEEKQGPANIELNVFGYFATHLLRPVGLSGIRIT